MVNVVFSKSLKFGLIGAALIIYAGVASAATITVNSVNAAWQSATLGDGTNLTISDPSKISWGGDLGDGQSSYSVSGVDSSFTVAAGETFTLGTFVHENQPIAKPTLSVAELLVNINIASFGVEDTFFNFTHTETRNRAKSCQFEGQDEGGNDVNRNGCADQVEATLDVTSSNQFSIGEDVFKIEFVGFKVGETVFEKFLTAEKLATEADLIGRFVQLNRNPPPPVVPTPASGLLLLSAFGAAAYVKRRKAKAS